MVDKARDEPVSPQQQWFALSKRLGSEQAARTYLAARLRQVADLVEAANQPNVFPDVYGVKINDGDDFQLESSFFAPQQIMASITVILSYPWPG